MVDGADSPANGRQAVLDAINLTTLGREPVSPYAPAPDSRAGALAPNVDLAAIVLEAMVQAAVDKIVTALDKSDSELASTRYANALGLLDAAGLVSANVLTDIACRVGYVNTVDQRDAQAEIRRSLTRL
jgi:hypothetical protein